MTKAKCRIEMFMHCKECIRTMPDNMSPKSWARLSVGWTGNGLQVWCSRHNLDVATIRIDDDGKLVGNFPIPPAH